VPRVERRDVAAEGGSVLCEVAGTGSPLVLTHDGLVHRETWDAQFTSLADTHRVVRWDRRGFGLSARPTVQYSSVDDLVCVIESAAEGSSVLIGSSYGSLISLHCALDRPDLVSALVLVGPIVSGLDLTEHFFSRGGLWSSDYAAPATQIAYWSDIDRWLVAAQNTSARKRVAELLAANPQNLEPDVSLEQAPQPAALPRLDDIGVPTLIIVGEYDIPDVHAHAGALQAGIRGAQRLVLADSGHLPQLEVPDAFNRSVRDFLAKLSG
jgi:pimeloyl-ACP methyl ester carboxylesterase